MNCGGCKLAEFVLYTSAIYLAITLAQMAVQNAKTK